MIDGSYRIAPSQPRFVCLACEERSADFGACPGCGVERLPLADLRVREELAAAGERRLHARAGGEQRLLGVAAFLVAPPLRWSGGWLYGMLAWFAASLIFCSLSWRLVARFSRGSARHVFYLRRRDQIASRLPA